MVQRILRALRRPSTTRTTRVVVTCAALTLAVASTDPGFDERGGAALDWALWLCVAGLTADWARRVARVAARAAPGMRAAAAARYLVSPSGLADAVAALAVPVAWALGARDAQLWLFGVFWSLKLTQSAPRLARLRRVLGREAGSLGAVATLAVVVIFLSAAAMFAVEGDMQPDIFGTMPRALWWAMANATGLGGDGTSGPETALGRLIASAVLVTGLGVFGLWAGILATGFADEIRREQFLGAWELVAQVPFLQSLGPGATADLAGALRRWDVPANTVVVRRGQRGECMYFVAEGEAEVLLPSGPPVPIREGSFFGEMALLTGGGGVRSATVRCPRAATLLVLDVADFRALVARHPALAAAVEKEAARRRADGGVRGAPRTAPERVPAEVAPGA